MYKSKIQFSCAEWGIFAALCSAVLVLIILVVVLTKPNWVGKPYVNIKISTIGDSITMGSRPGDTMEFGNINRGWYQYYFYYYLQERGIESIIINLGIGGQKIRQIVDRLDSTIPSNYVVIMGGTNDIIWANYSESDVNQKLADRIISAYEETIPLLINKQIEISGFAPIIIICSVPPIANLTTLPKGMPSAIKYVNLAILEFVKLLNLDNVIFSDTNRHLRGDSDYYISGLSTPEGIHLSEKGNLVTGEAIAESVVENYYKW
jgi:lysophospholipase L1-like esterase